MHAAMLAYGCHVNAVGAITPEREEFAEDVFARRGQIAVDSLEAVQKLSKEFITRYAGEGWQRVMPLSQLLAHQEKRRGEAGVALFNATGMGISDLALGAEIYGRALKQGVDRNFPQPQHAKPRLKRSGIQATA